MKKINLLLYAPLLASSLFAQEKKTETTLLDKAASFSLFKEGDNFIDFKFIDPSKGSFGIDYKLALKDTIGSLGFNFKNLNIGLSSTGFVTVVGGSNPNNSIINELKFEAFPLIRVNPKKITNFEKVNAADFFDDPEVPAVDDPLINEARKLSEQVSSPFYVFYNIHTKHETTQEFKNYDFTLGTQISFTTSLLNAFLDFPFGLLRYGKNNNPRHLDFSIGYDYVIGMDKTALAPLLNGKNYMNRLNLKGEWETGILSSRDRLLLLFDSYHDLKATQQLKNANKDWNTFFMAKVEHLLTKDRKSKTRTKVSIKYTNGKLPPNFIQGYVLGGGFSIEF